jgi:hypothetical protein
MLRSALALPAKKFTLALLADIFCLPVKSSNVKHFALFDLSAQHSDRISNFVIVLRESLMLILQDRKADHPRPASFGRKI